jgi:exopolysaccharide biosynthesis polyprenyl glycosylphosphotransferase
MYQAGSSVGTALLTSHHIGLVPVSRGVPCRWPMHGWRGTAKRTMDVCVALVGLTVLLVPMLLAVLLICLESPGPALFRQRRIGFGNVAFEIWKLRTMRQHTQEQGSLTQVTRHDPRVTRVGRWLRRWSLDELPQLFNVLRGEMSLVGPRPHAPGTCAGGKPFEAITPHYPARHRVRPGMTGLAQVRGLRGETATEQKLLQRIAADLEYIDHWSLWLDVKILARTAVALFTTQCAY